MQTHIPDRSPTRRLRLPPVQDEHPAKRNAPSTTGFRLRRMLVFASAVAILLLMLLGIVSVQRKFEELTDRCRQYETGMAGLSRELETRAAEVEQLEQSLKSVRADRDQLTEMLAKAQRQLDDALRAGDSTKSLLNQIQEQLKQLLGIQSVRASDVNRSREELDQLRRRHYEQLLQMGRTVKGDPALALQTLEAALEFASTTGLPAEAARLEADALSHPAEIPPGAIVSVLDIQQVGTQLVADVRVTDASGKFITSLSRVDFEVHSANGRLHLVGVTTINRNDRSHSTVLLLDYSASTTGPPHQAMVAGTSEFVRRIANPSRLIVYGFANDVRALSPWSTDASLHLDAIQQLTPDGGTALYKGVRLAAVDLASKPGVRSIVLFTDGSDSFKDETIDQTLATCRQHAIAIHVVALQTAEINEPLLRRIASETNGLFLKTTDPARLTEQFEAIAATFQEPVYRVTVFESLDEEPLQLQVGTLSAVPLHAAIRNTATNSGT